MTSPQGSRHLQTDRLDLRAMTPDDLGALHRIISDPRNCVHIPEGPKESLADSRAWVERFSARWGASGLGYWTVRLRATSAVIGVGGAGRPTDILEPLLPPRPKLLGIRLRHRARPRCPARSGSARAGLARGRVDTPGERCLAGRGTAPRPDRLRPARAAALGRAADASMGRLATLSWPGTRRSPGQAGDAMASLTSSS